jgi:hypothetical protein
MNATVKPQAVSRIIAAAGITKSKTQRGKICNAALEGFEVWTTPRGNVLVTYVQSTYSKASTAEFAPTQQAALEAIATTLRANGYSTHRSHLNGVLLVEKVAA